MDINIFQFSDRVLIIDRSNDEFVRAKTITALEKHGFLCRVFDLLHKIPTNQYYINLFRYHAGLKQLSNVLITKPRKGKSSDLKRIDNIRLMAYHFFQAINSVHKPITAELVLRILNEESLLYKLSQDALLNGVIDMPILLINDDKARNILISSIHNTRKDKLFDATHIGGSHLDEIDLSVFVHCDVPVFLYCPESQENSELTDNLLRNYLRSALKVDRYKLSNDDRLGLERLINEIKSNCEAPVKHNAIATPSTLHSLMA